MTKEFIITMTAANRAGILSAVLVVAVIGQVANHALAKFAPTEKGGSAGTRSDASREDRA